MTLGQAHQRMAKLMLPSQGESADHSSTHKHGADAAETKWSESVASVQMHAHVTDDVPMRPVVRVLPGGTRLVTALSMLVFD